MVALDQPRGQGHGGQRHGNTVRLFREQLLCHHGPGRAAGCSHKWQLFRYLLHKINGFLGGTQVSPHRHLKNVRKPKGLHGCTQLSRRYLWAKLSHKCRRHRSIHALSRLDGPDHLEYLGLIRNGSKGAVYKAHTAGYAFIIINVRLTVFI